MYYSCEHKCTNNKEISRFTKLTYICTPFGLHRPIWVAASQSSTRASIFFLKERASKFEALKIG